MNSLFYAIGAPGFFMSRAFLPAFCTALCLRFGDSLPFLKEIPLVQEAGIAPSWFTSSWVIGLLGLLALIEIGVTKFPEFSNLMDGIHKYIRLGMAGVTTFGFLPVGDAHFIGQTLNIPRTSMVDAIISVIAALLVWFSATLRNSIMNILHEIDEEDDLGLQSFISWLEDGWSFLIIVLFFIYPLLVVFLVFIITGFFLILRAYLRHKEEKRKIPCPSCGEPVYSSALKCQSCKNDIANPKDINIFGTATESFITDRSLHALKLTEKHRCPSCATRLKKRSVHQTCNTCGMLIFETTETKEKYLKLIQKRLLKTLIIVTGLSFIPIVGMIPGIIYYRFRLVTPYKAYIPTRQGIVLKVFTKTINFLLIGLQVVPFAGGAALPIMAIMNYKVYRRYFIKQFKREQLGSKPEIRIGAMYCSNCGKEINSDAHFCPFCGSKAG